MSGRSASPSPAAPGPSTPADGPAAAQAGLGQGLDALLRRLLPGCQGIAGLRRLSAGATLETWSFDALGVVAPGPGHGLAQPVGDASNACWPLILRRSPGGLRGNETLSLATEAALLGALAEAEPGLAPWLARVLHVLQPADGLGDGFIMGRIAGETIARKIQRDDAFAPVRPRLVPQLGQALGLIHRADTTRLPALPRRGLGHTLAQLAERTARLHRPNPVFAWGVRWLGRHAPDASDERTVLVHGDYRLGNVIVAPAAAGAGVTGGLAAVLDWEIAHLGDPAEDLAWIALPPWRFGQLDRPVAGLGGFDDFLAAHEATTGWTVDRHRLRWWLAAGSLRWGLGCAGMRDWFASGRDARAERGMIARRVSENELDLLQLVAPEGAAAGLAAHRAALRAAAEPSPHGGLIDEPDGARLVDAVARWLRESVVAAGGEHAFHGRVAANALDLALREARQAAAARAAASVRLARLLGDGAAAGPAALPEREAELCRRITTGAIALDDPALLEHLWAGTLDRIAIDQPAYASYRALLVKHPGA